MSYLDHYKAGSALFRTLSESRMRFQVLCNAIRYNSPPPDSIIGIQDYMKKHADSCVYEKRSDPRVFAFPRTDIEPHAARPLLEKEGQVEFPESFVLRVPKGRVLGDGTVIGEDNAILSETTTDFHRKQEYHHLLHEYKIPSIERFEGCLAVVASPGSHNYFHWTLDSLPRLRLLQGLDDEIDAYYMDNRSRFHREWIDMLGIPEEKIIAASPKRHIQATKLLVPSFAGIAGLPSPEGLNFVRSFMPPTEGGRKRIYISRSGARRRRILNEPDILPLLKQYGFETIRPAEMTVKEQMQTFASADVVVSPHGAELTNLAFCRPGTKVIEILSPYYLNPCFKKIAALSGLQYTALVGTGGRRVLGKGMDAHYVWANIHVNTGSLKAELDSSL